MIVTLKVEKLRRELEMNLRSPRQTPTGSPMGNPMGTPTGLPKTTTLQALECEAWNESNSNDDSAWKGPVNIDFKPPKIPCLAIHSADGVYYTAEKMSKSGRTGQMVRITPGSHVFVKLAHEDFLRIGLTSHSFGSAAGNSGPD